MLKRMSFLMILALALPALAAAEDWSHVSMIDTNCSDKVKADPDSHTRACALKCAKGGYGILDKDGNYLKFDEKGNREAMKLLQNTNQKDHLRVNVSGKKEGDTIKVESLKM
jgi:hypothetical protein